MNLPYFPIYGGANKINRTIAGGLARRGHTVEAVVPALGVPSRLTHAQLLDELASEGIVVTAHDKHDTFNIEGVTVHAVREPTQLRTSLVERVERFKPDRVLLSSEDPSHNLLDALVKVCSDRIVYLIHTVSFLPFGPQAFFPSRSRAKLLERIPVIISISNYVAHYIKEWGGLDSTVIYWPTYGEPPFPDLSRFDEGYVTMVNPCAIKGISIFIELARALPEVEFAGVLTWGAVEEDRRALERLPNVRLLEPSRDIEDIFARTRVLVMPSLWEESFGLTAVEAMLRGIPVLASDIGGLPEAKLGTDFLLPVRPIERFGERLNENMLPLPVVPEQDVRPWSDALRQLLSERKFYERQSTAARDAALNFVSSLSLDPLERLLAETNARPNALDERPTAAPYEIGDTRTLPNGAGERSGEPSAGLDELTPEQQSLLMLLLREKAAKQTDAQPRAQGIQPVPRQGSVPLSFAQQRLWFLDQFEPNSAVYNIPAAVRLSGTLDAAALERSFNEVVRRHEILRTGFALVNGQPAQEIADSLALTLPVLDLSWMNEREREAEVRRRASEEAQLPFDLTRAPLWRATLLRVAPDEHVLLLTMHHIISDAWSMGILIREVAALYEAFTRGQKSPLPELPIQYADFAHWQRQWLEGERLDAQLSYWREQLADIPALLELPTDRPRPAVQTYRGASETFRLSRELTEELQRLSRQEGATLFMTLLAAFQALLARYADTSEVAVGTPIAGRSRAELEGLIGFFVNTLVLRTDLSGQPTFLELLGRVREVTLEAYAHQDVPFEKLVEELQPARELSHAPLFQVMFTLQNAPRPSLELPGLKLAQVELDAGTAMFDLSLSVEETPRGLFGVFEYNTDLFDASTIRRLAAHLQNLLAGVVAAPRRRVSDVLLLNGDEQRLLLSAWNETREDYPSEKPLHEFIEAQAERTPDAFALFFEDETLTYGELNARANQLAHYLMSRAAVAPETVVGICMERSLEMVIALLGIMKAGGAYLPLEPEYPKERLSYMLRDARAAVILTQRKFVEKLPEHKARVVCVETDGDEIARASTHNPASVVAASNLIYVIYTSGSTGEPKGAMLAHRGVSNCLLWMQQRHKLTADDRVLLKAPLSFDSSVWELFWPLMVGASVVVARAGEQRDSTYLAELIARRRVTTVHFVPSMFQVFLEEKNLEACASLRHVVCGGEALPVASVGRFYARLKAELHNFYGPTETSIGSIDYICSEKDVGRWIVPIGRPIANAECYLLDANLQPVPVGVSGELYTGGVGLARGYIGRPALTAEKFIPHPFSAGGPGARLYRTGDRARYLPDGNIEFLGRADHQVKLRGLRIELGEIEAALGKHPAVHDVVVIVREDVPGDKRLVAYTVFKTGVAAVPASELRLFLKETLPDFMLPSAFVALDKLPLTHNIKVDRRALPAPDASTRHGASDAYVAPRTPHELIVASIWTQVLGVQTIGLHDNFFELGGHSLLATQVMSRLRESFKVELPLRTLFESPTVSELARRVERAGESRDGSVAPEIKPVSREGNLPLSFAQQRLWFLDQLVPDSPFYNLPLAVELVGQLDHNALEQTLSEITRRHEALRTNFTYIDGQPVQVVSPAHKVNIPVIDLTAMEEGDREAEVRRLAADEARAPFDLRRAPLLRIKLLRTAADHHVLLLTMHHIISDAWSMGILIREVAALYEAFTRGQKSPLPELPIQYADFAHWQREWLEGQRLDAQLSYWREQLADIPALLELPTDRPRPAVQTYRGASETFRLSRELTEELQRLSRQEGATLFMTLLAAFQALLARYADTSEVAVGTPIAGRSRAELEGLIGFFVNTLVLRTNLSDDPTVIELLRRVREVTLEAYAHQDVPFEKLVEELQPARELSHAPLFQVMFTLQNAAAEQARLAGLEMRPLEVESGVAKFDLTLSLSESEAGLWGSLEYNLDLFDEETARRMRRHFERLLEEMVAKPERRVSELELLDEVERRQLFEEWNATWSEYAREMCVHELVEASAGRSPDALAVASENGEWTYGELNRRANRLARYLRRRGVRSGEVVAVLMERSAEMVCGWLAVLKAGGAYLPLDASYPSQRLEMMLDDAGVKTVLTEERFLAAVAGRESSVVCVDRDRDIIARASAENLAGEANAESLAYVIYTSGSTGRPKGILIPHRAVARLVCNTNYVRLDSSDRIAQASNASFDAATFEIWGALVSGARLVVINREVVLSPAEFGAEIRRQGITALFLTTALFNLLAREAPDSFGSLKHLLFGGEAVDAARVREIIERAPPERLLHVYGPTESTTFASWFLIQSVPAGAWTIPVGRPVSNTQIYILDKNLRPVPVGVAGELCIGGDGLAHGYLNSPELTAEKFVPNTFNAQAGARLYRTGDRARYLPDGNIEFLGRADRQVKLRGFRIELEEIETALGEHPSVREAVVVLHEVSPDDKRLVAYLASADGEASADLLRAYLRRKLPEYMIPATYVLMDALPLTPNGKVDRRALPAPEEFSTTPDADFLAPRNTTELQLAQIWEEVLNVRPVGVTDNFFALGGHSLLAVRLMAQVRKQFGRDLPLDTLFKGATVESLATIIRQEAAPGWSPLVAIQPAVVGSTKPPVFFVHPAGGNIICYVALARHLGIEQPFYGLQARGLDGRDEPFARLGDMAAYYIDAVRRVQPDGPYLLGGWSLGGVVAYEMARQMQASGQEAALLALLDSPAPVRPLEELDEVKLLAGLASDLALPISEEELRRLEPDARLLHLLEQARRQRLVPLDYDLAQARRLLRVYQTNVRALSNYQPQPSAQRITLFRARESAADNLYDARHSDINRTLGWAALSTHPVDVQEVPGDHIGMITEPHVQSLAAQLKHSLTETQSVK
jgi:amino acid adenylation domain-containing protein